MPSLPIRGAEGSGGQGASSRSYAYDAMDRMTDVYRSGSSRLATSSYAADGLNRDAAIAGLTGGYDARGNLTSDGSKTYAYDLENRLTSVGGAASVSLSYDPLGRLWQTVAGGATTQFLYAGDMLVAEYDGAGNVLRRYVPGASPDGPLAWYEGAGTSTLRYLHADNQGSIIAWSDGNSNLGAAYAYGPYGEPQAWGGSRYAYTGQIALPEAGLYHYKARAYDPTRGWFLQTDPVGYESDLDLYAYVGEDPLNDDDPTGECPTAAHCYGDGYGDIDATQGSDSRIDPNAGTHVVLVGLNKEGTVATYQRVDSKGNVRRTFTLATGKANDAPAPWELVMPGGIARGAAVEAAEVGGELAVKAAGREAGELAGDFVRAVCCFTAGTLVSTKDGLKPIEAIQVGDLVLSRDPSSGATAYKPILSTIRRHDRDIWRVKLQVRLPDGSSRTDAFDTTEDHPWRTADGRWLTTMELTRGVQIARAYGQAASVISITDTHRIRPTFNLEVADFHTYFVGEDRVWVHNGKCDKILGKLAGRSEEIAGNVARSRGASGQVVREMGHWAQKTLREVAQGVADGDPGAARAMKLVKQARRVGQIH